MKIVVVASLAYSLVNFRGALLATMAADGHEVVACAPEDDRDIIDALAGIGVHYRRYTLGRSNLDPLQDLQTVIDLVSLLRAEKPDIVLAYTQKPIIYGGVAAQLAGCRRFYAMVSGLGYVFADDGGGVRKALRRAVSMLYRLAVRRARAIFVFNDEDCAELRRNGVIRVDHNVVRVPGSGVDLTHFAHQPVPSGPPVFLMVARLLRDKGVVEFAEAARQLRSQYPGARFQLLGPTDPNPSGIPMSQVANWVSEGIVEYLGETRDVAPHLARATVFVLPTYYREGLPRSILEALATGRPVITTDTPGCRDTVQPGVNGYLVPVRNVPALTTAMARLLQRPDLADQMGRQSRKLAEARFSVEHVNRLVLATMGLRSSDVPRNPAVPSFIRVAQTSAKAW